MPDPRKYTPGYNFRSIELAAGKGVQLDTQLNEIATSLGEAIDAVKDIRRSDGKIHNGIVLDDALDPPLLAEIRAATAFRASAEQEIASVRATASTVAQQASAVGQATSQTLAASATARVDAALADARADDAASFAGNRDYKDVATLLANTALAYGSGAQQVSEGDVIRTRREGFSYRVAASGATTHHVATAGGIKLVVSRPAEGWNVKAFGAVSDWNGTTGTDSSPAIRKARDAAFAAGGGRVIIPAGAYYLASAIPMKDGVHFIGEAYSSVAMTSSASGPVLWIGGSANCFTLDDGSAQDVVVQNIAIRSNSATSGDAFRLSGDRRFLNSKITDVRVRGMRNAIRVGTTMDFQCIAVANCEFAYQRNEHVYYEDNAEYNAVVYRDCRFEQTNSGYRLLNSQAGGLLAFGLHRFENCVFETVKADFACYFNANCMDLSFVGCHFEGNAIEMDGGFPIDGGGDVYIGAGLGAVTFINNGFAGPNYTATNFHCVVLASSEHKVTFIGNALAKNPLPSGFAGFVKVPRSTARFVTFIGNNFADPAQDFYKSSQMAVRLNSKNSSPKYGEIYGPSVATLTTTNATLTALWGSGGYNFRTSTVQAHLVTAEVTCVSTDGEVYGAWVLRRLFTTNGSNSVTGRGNMNETAVTSGGTLAAVIRDLANNTTAYGYEVAVTGVASTSVKWIAKVEVTEIDI